jgi:long-chain-fatty-acid--CoA ligase ACSBG
MTDDRVVMMSTQGYKSLVNSENGKGLHWACDINDELPVKLRSSGPGSERPLTVPQMFLNSVKSGGDRASVKIERDGKVLTWTWDQYFDNSMAFAKSLAHLKVKERSAVAIMGFNSPEWIFAFVGGIMYNCVNTGIYSTNAPDACLYQAEHSEAEVIVVETNDMLKRFVVNLDKLPRVKAIVVWGEKELPSDV